MRTIKFRAWTSYPIGMMSWENFGHDIAWHLSGENHDDRILAVMQYTGLEDRNGVEVYEGDIVRCSMGAIRPGCPHVVEWCRELGGKYNGGMPGWYLSDLKSGQGEGYAWTGEEEIIGNIHQNANLLPSESGTTTATTAAETTNG